MNSSPFMHFLSQQMKSSTRLFLMAFIGIWILNLATMPAMAQSSSNSSMSANLSSTTPLPSSMTSSTQSNAPVSSGNSSTEMSNSTATPSGSTTVAPSGANALWSNCNTLLLIGLQVLINLLAFSHRAH